MPNQIFDSLFTIINFFNNPKHDTNILRKAGIKEDKNLLPVVVRVGKNSSISVGDLAEQLGKDHSSVSRQVDKFVEKGILSSYPSDEDRRVRKVTLTKIGKKLYDQIAETREEMMEELLEQLNCEEIEELNTSLKKLSDLLKNIK